LEPASGQDWLAVASGSLGLTLHGDGLPLGWQADREREVAAGELLPAFVPGTLVTLRNVGEAPLVLLRLRVLPIATGPPEEALVVPRLTALPVDQVSDEMDSDAVVSVPVDAPPDTAGTLMGKALLLTGLAGSVPRRGATMRAGRQATLARRRRRRPPRPRAEAVNVPV
jgi:hypothetical protein